MTTTNMFQGLQGDKNTSRVLRPPGGASSNIFGSDPAPAVEQKSRQASSNIFGPVDARPAPPRAREDTANKLFGGSDESPSKKKQEKDEEEDKEKENNDKDTANAKVAPPVPEQGSGEQPSEAAAPTVKHVRQPPGGKSTPLW